MQNLFIKFRKPSSNRPDGFSIIEVVVAVYIISMGLLGIFTLFNQNIQVQIINRHELVASQLAQEGLELVRNVRDENWFILGGDWDDDITDFDNTFIIDHRGRSQIDDSADAIGDAGARLYFDANGFYSHQISANATPFYRLITISNITAYSMAVDCLVRWQANNYTRDYKAETMLYDWR